MFDNSIKLDAVRTNLTGFFQDIVKFIEELWKTIEKYFKKDAPDYSPLVNEDESEAE